MLSSENHIVTQTIGKYLSFASLQMDEITFHIRNGWIILFEIWGLKMIRGLIKLDNWIIDVFIENDEIRVLRKGKRRLIKEYFMPSSFGDQMKVHSSFPV